MAGDRAGVPAGGRHQPPAGQPLLARARYVLDGVLQGTGEPDAVCGRWCATKA